MPLSAIRMSACLQRQGTLRRNGAGCKACVLSSAPTSAAKAAFFATAVTYVGVCIAEEPGLAPIDGNRTVQLLESARDHRSSCSVQRSLELIVACQGNSRKENTQTTLVTRAYVDHQQFSNNNVLAAEVRVVVTDGEFVLDDSCAIALVDEAGAVDDDVCVVVLSAETGLRTSHST